MYIKKLILILYIHKRKVCFSSLKFPKSIDLVPQDFLVYIWSFKSQNRISLVQNQILTMWTGFDHLDRVWLMNNNSKKIKKIWNFVVTKMLGCLIYFFEFVCSFFEFVVYQSNLVNVFKPGQTWLNPGQRIRIWVWTERIRFSDLSDQVYTFGKLEEI